MAFVLLVLLAVVCILGLLGSSNRKSTSNGLLKVTGYKNGEVVYMKNVAEGSFSVRTGSSGPHNCDKFIIEEIK